MAVNLAGNVTRQGSAIVKHPFFVKMNNRQWPVFLTEDSLNTVIAKSQLRRFAVSTNLKIPRFARNSNAFCLSWINLLSYYQEIRIVRRQRLSNCNYIFVKSCLFVATVVSTLTVFLNRQVRQEFRQTPRARTQIKRATVRSSKLSTTPYILKPHHGLSFSILQKLEIKISTRQRCQF